MTTSFRTILFIAVCALVSAQAQASVDVATWTFSGTGADITNPYNANTPLVTGISSASLTVASPNGATLSTQSSGGAPSGAGGFAQIGDNSNLDQTKVNGSTLNFSLSTSTGTSLALSALTFNYEDLGNKSATSINWTYSINGGSATSLTSSTLNNSVNTWQSGSLNLTGISLSGGQTITIFGTLVDLESGNGTGSAIGFDNFVITAGSLTSVPEPIHMALAAFGLIFVGTGAGRFYLARIRRA